MRERWYQQKCLSWGCTFLEDRRNVTEMHILKIIQLIEKYQRE
jgi:hypothetical protein